MSNKKTALNSIVRKIIPILRKEGVAKAGIFGSFARGEQKKRSDLDLLIQFRGRKSLLDLVGLELELEDKLGRKVDLLTYKSLHPLLKERILQEEVRIL